MFGGSALGTFPLGSTGSANVPATPPTPPVTYHFEIEGVTDDLLLEDGTSYLLLEEGATIASYSITGSGGLSFAGAAAVSRRVAMVGAGGLAFGGAAAA